VYFEMREVGKGMKPTMSSRSVFSATSTWSVRTIWRKTLWWLTQALPMVKKLTT